MGNTRWFCTNWIDWSDKRRSVHGIRFIWSTWSAANGNLNYNFRRNKNFRIKIETFKRNRLEQMLSLHSTIKLHVYSELKTISYHIYRNVMVSKVFVQMNELVDGMMLQLVSIFVRRNKFWSRSFFIEKLYYFRVL